MGEEKVIQNNIIEWLRNHPAVGDCWQNDQIAVKGRVFKTKYRRLGVPDIIGYLTDGRFFGVEVKKPDGKVSFEQQEFISRASSFKCLVFVARSLMDVSQAFDQFRRASLDPQALTQSQASTSRTSNNS